MRNLQVNVVMLGFLVYVSLVVVCSMALGKPELVDQLSSFLYFLLLLNAIGIASYFLRNRNTEFRSSFLLAYFGVIVCLFLFNVVNLIYGYANNVFVSLVILALLVYYTVYPFLNRKLDLKKN